jgi:hypothetical protein
MENLTLPVTSHTPKPACDVEYSVNDKPAVSL